MRGALAGEAWGDRASAASASQGRYGLSLATRDVIDLGRFAGTRRCTICGVECGDACRPSGSSTGR